MIKAVFYTLGQVIVPIAIPVMAGWLLRKKFGLDTGPLMTITLYVLVPALVFDALMKAELNPGMIGSTLAFCTLNILLMWLIAYLWSRLLRLSAPDRAGLGLIATTTNSVNYGIPLILMAFGQTGMDFAAVYVIIGMILMNTVSVYIAARSHFSVRDAILSVFKLPAVYAAALAGVLKLLDVQVPAGLASGISMLATALPPLVLMVLGSQMAGVRKGDTDGGSRKTFWSGLAIRMLVAPAVAAPILWALGIKGIQFMVLLILASMPVAVNAVILAEKFDASPKVLAKCILWTTLASFIVLPLVIGIGVGA